MSRSQPVVAIDGPGSGGKGTVGTLLAKKLGCLFVDTGAMYRALTVRALQQQIDLEDQDRLGRLARECRVVFRGSGEGDKWAYRIDIDGSDVTEQIRTPQIDMASSKISAYADVHQAMVEKQRQLAQESGVVMEGRDIGTVVLPGADIKFYLTASVEERARRRYLQMKSWGREVDRDELEDMLRKRDRDDSSREVAPLCQAEDAIVIDTTELTVEQVLEEMLARMKQKLGPEHA
jgi:cytidylate kinase